MNTDASGPERRQHWRVRACFPQACELLRPFFEPGNQWLGQSQDELAYRTVRDRFPELDPQEANLVVATARRFFADKRDLPAD